VAGDQESSELVEGAASLLVRLSGLEGVTPEYANIIHVNTDGQVFQVIFSQIMPPVILGEEDREELKQRGTISGKVIARLVLTPAVLAQAVDVMRGQLDLYQEQQASSAPAAPQATNG
jgi:hypothetical protein